MAEDDSAIPGTAAGNPIHSRAALRAKLTRELDEPVFSPSAPPAIPDHTLLRRIGSGACGEVWLARNALGTLRAVKIVYRARFRDDRPYEREFGGILKYEPVSRTHEGLVQVLHVGRNDNAGCFYYVMELADNVAQADVERLASGAGEGPKPQDAARYHPRTLRAELGRRQRFPPSEAAQLALLLSRALGHLHTQGLVHRDIKPSNVIFVSGQPKLADIGLVTDVGSSQSFVGTEGFIAPEGPGTPQADLYALGKLLYELVTGRDRMDFPQLPPRVRELADGESLLELNEVVTRACAPDRADRYATTTELQAELNLFLAGRSLRRTRSIERGLKRLRSFSIAACVMLTLAIGALWFSRREQHHALERERAASERARSETALRERAEAAERQSRQQLYTAVLEQARATVRSGDLGQRVHTLEAIGRAAAISNSVELRREALAALALPDLQFDRELPLGSEFTMRWLDPTFERVALCRGLGPVEIRAVSDNRLIATLPASTNLMAYAALWSGDGRFLAVKRDYQDGGVRADLEVWEIINRRRVALIHGLSANARSFHPLKPQIMVAEGRGFVSLWDLEEGKLLARREVGAAAERLAYSPDGTFVAASYRMNGSWGVSVHEASESTLVASNVFANFVSALAWHPDGQQIAVTDYSGGVQMMDSRTGKLVTLGRHRAEAATALFSPSGEYLFTGGWERELICWDARTMQRAMTVALDSYIMQFRADGQACALTTLLGLQLHAFEPPAIQRQFSEDLGPRLRHAAFSPDGRWLAASADGRMGVWDLAGGPSGTLANSGSETQLFWKADSSELFGSSRLEDCFRWRVQAATNSFGPPQLERLELARPAGFASLSVAVNLVAWTSSGRSRIAGLESDTAGRESSVETVQGVSGISPDERWLGVYRPFGTVLHVYSLPGLEFVARLTNQAFLAGFSFSPSMDELGVGSRGQVEFWSTKTWQRTRAVTNFVGIPDVGMIFQPDGRTVWLAKDLRTAGLYDVHTLEPIFFLPTGVFPMTLSADGRQLAVTVDGQRLQVWDLVAVRKHFRELGLDWTEH